MLANTNNYKGKISVTFNQEDIRKMCVRYIPDFKEERFDIIALRFFSGKENVLTIYAVDKLSESSILPEGKIPVRKFKIELSDISELLELIAGYNFTLCNEAYSLGEMEVMNR